MTKIRSSPSCHYLFLQFKWFNADKFIDFYFFCFGRYHIRVCGLAETLDMSLSLVWIDPFSVIFSPSYPLEMIAIILYVMKQMLYWSWLSNWEILPWWVTVTNDSHMYISGLDFSPYSRLACTMPCSACPLGCVRGISNNQNQAPDFCLLPVLYCTSTSVGGW